MIVYSQQRICKTPNWAVSFVDRTSHTINGAETTFDYDAVCVAECCTTNLSF